MAGVHSGVPGAEPTAITPRTASRKRPRQTVKEDEMDTDHLSGASRMRKSKKITSLQAAVPTQPRPSINPVAGPSSSFPLKAKVSLIRRVTRPPTEPTCTSVTQAAAVPVADSYVCGVADDLQEELTRLQREVAQLKEQLGLQIKNNKADKLQVAQEIMLDRIREQKENNERLARLQRQRYYAAQRTKDQEAECEKQKKKVEESNKKYAKTLVDLNYYKDETDHLQSLNKIMEEDLDELRRIDNEERAERLLNKHDLPPSYGSLDDEDDSMLPLLHLDSGSFDVAALKRTVHRNFSQKLSHAQTEADNLRASESSSADMVVFIQSSLALADSSRVLKAALDQAAFMSINTIETIPESSHQASTSEQTRRLSKRCQARRDFVADRIAKTLLSLAWRVVSATELRPVPLILTASSKSRLCVAYKELDDCFLETLRHIFLLSETERPAIDLLYGYQHYLTQICALRRSFNNLGAGLSYSLFTKSWEWLGDQLELERMNRANQEPNAGVDTLGEVFRGQLAGSEVSSEMSRSESVSVSSECVPVA